MLLLKFSELEVGLGNPTSDTICIRGRQENQPQGQRFTMKTHRIKPLVILVAINYSYERMQKRQRKISKGKRYMSQV